LPGPPFTTETQRGNAATKIAAECRLRSREPLDSRPFSSAAAGEKVPKADEGVLRARHKNLRVPQRNHWLVVQRTQRFTESLLAVVYPNLHRPPVVQAAAFDRSVRRLLKLERLLLALSRVKPYYAVVVSRKEDPGEEGE
jgi:hypothetical protein